MKRIEDMDHLEYEAERERIIAELSRVRETPDGAEKIADALEKKNCARDMPLRILNLAACREIEKEVKSERALMNEPQPDPMERKRQERMDEFREHGVQTMKGQWKGAIAVDATNAERLLKLLRRLEKLSTP